MFVCAALRVQGGPCPCAPRDLSHGIVRAPARGGGWQLGAAVMADARIGEAYSSRWRHDLLDSPGLDEFNRLYVKGQRLAEGFFGRVYWASRTDGRPPKPVAVKMQPSSKDRTQAWAIEFHIQKLASGHPHVVSLVEAYMESRDMKWTTLLVMELRSGSLCDFVHFHGAVADPDIKRWVRHTCIGLGHIHKLSIVHRDTKPANCLLAHQPEAPPSLNICDFGSAAVVVASSTLRVDKHSVLLPLACLQTSFPYAPPEVFRREEYGCSLDIWSAGIILFELMQADAREFAVQCKSEDAVDWLRVVEDFVEKLQEQSRTTLGLSAGFAVAMKMLSPTPCHRPSASQLLDEPWLRECPSDSQLASCRTETMALEVDVLFSDTPQNQEMTKTPVKATRGHEADSSEKVVMRSGPSASIGLGDAAMPGGTVTTHRLRKRRKCPGTQRPVAALEALPEGASSDITCGFDSRPAWFLIEGVDGSHAQRCACSGNCFSNCPGRVGRCPNVVDLVPPAGQQRGGRGPYCRACRCRVQNCSRAARRPYGASLVSRSFGLCRGRWPSDCSKKSCVSGYGRCWACTD